MISEIKIVEKVTGFVTRGHGHKKELLVFRHPLAGIQVPAGTVELGESVEDAMLREVSEETGIRALEVVKYLGKQTYTYPQEEAIVIRKIKIFDAPSFDASSVGFGLGRGQTVRIVGASGEYTEVVTEALDESRFPPVAVADVTGFVRSTVLTRTIRRYHYHLESKVQTSPSWQVPIDGHLFQFYWTLLTPITNLNPIQQTWLDQVIDQL